jgi:hypothetical protein
LHDLYVRACQAARKPKCESRVDFHRCKARYFVAQDVSTKTWSGADLEDVVTEVSLAKRPGKQLVLHETAHSGLAQIRR